MTDVRQTTGHQIIMASAGTGKTFALTGRIIRLLALGVPLERMVALTFTRAAAGEMFDTLVGRLATAAAAGPQAAREARAAAGLGEFDQTRVIGLLREVTSRMHLSPIGTLDSFFVRVLRSFPFEFGISGEFSLIEGHALTLERQRVLRAILQSPGDRAAADSRAGFLEAFKRATFGAEEKRLYTLLESFVDAYHADFLAGVDPACWGEAACIWPSGGTWWRELSPQESQRALATSRRGLEAMAPTEPQRERWEAFLGLAGEFAPGGLIDKAAADVFEKLLAARGDLERGAATLVVARRRFDLSAEMGAAVLALAGHVVACTVRSRLEATRGLRDILARYEQVYDQTVRHSGRLAFADVVHLMTRGVLADARLEVDYRLDGCYDHWALDEFQDTSRAQWTAIEPLVAEVVQDPEGRRTFFAVGDAKQAIYGWRGGESRLLGEIADRYAIQRTPLNDSYRCGPAVIEAVNRVFSRLGEAGLPATLAERWQGIWEVHRSASREGGAGLVEVCEVGSAEGDGRVAPADWASAVVAGLKATCPWQRGLTTGVLVRSNTQGDALTEALRSQGIPAVWTGDKAIADNPAVAAVLDLLRCAEHPGDRSAWQHLLMSPLRGCLGEVPEGAADRVALQVLTSLSEEGFARTVEHWLMRLRRVVDLDPFSRQRLRLLLDAAEAFDRLGRRSCLEFCDFVEEYRVSDLAAAGTVQVMTLHRCKGLGFDGVVLPLFPGRSGLDSVHAGGLLQGPRSPFREGERPWLMLAPPSAIACADPVLREAVVAASEEAAFGELCLLYVGMTRARRALRLLVPPLPKSDSASLHLHTVVRGLLAGEAKAGERGLLARIGDETWHERFAVSKPAMAAPGPPARAPGRAGGIPRLRRAVPSSHADGGPAAGDLFIPSRQPGRAFGSALHGLLQQVAWVDDEPFAQVVARWRERSGLSPQVADAVVAAAARALGVPAIRSEFTRPGQPCELWRERSFDLVLDGEWVSGTFDRVVLSPGPPGRARRAVLVDLKSDQVAGEEGLARAVARYAAQMALYQRALCRLAGLPPDAVAARLVFSRAGRVVCLGP